MFFDYIIVGAGFAGAVIAERIANVLNKKVLVIEKRAHIGGNCFDYKDENNIIIHKYGPHIFHTDKENVYEYIRQFTKLNIYHHKVLAFIDGKKIPIPFNFNSINKIFPETFAKKIEKKLLNKFKINSKISILEFKKDEDEDLKFLSEYIYNKVFLNYTVKQWGISPAEIDESVISRVPVFIGRDNRYFNDKYQFIPEKGYTEIFRNLLNNKNIKLMMQTDFKEISEIRENKISFFGKEFKGKIIYTGAIDELFNYKYGYLPYRSLYFEKETFNTEYFQETAQVNYPNDYKFTRITEFKHFHNVESSVTTIFKEYPEEFIPGKNIRFYPVLTEKNRDVHKKYEKLSKKIKNLILVGRLSEYKYYNMDEIIHRALTVFKKEIVEER